MENEGKNMNQFCIQLHWKPCLALTAGGAQAAKDKRSLRAKPQQRSAKVQAARPANTGKTMSAGRNAQPRNIGSGRTQSRAQFYI